MTGGGYLFAYFTTAEEEDGEQIRFARSVGADPLHWEELHGGSPVVTSWIGSRGLRDPFLLRAAGLPGEAAKFYLLATDLRIGPRGTASDWKQCLRGGSRSIVISESVDLVTWSDPWLLNVAPPEAGNAWAPEACYDESSGSYFLYWASTLYDSDEDRVLGKGYNRMLGATTRDFRRIDPPQVWVDAGRSVIDATVVRDGEYFYRFIKDERTPDSSTPAAKFITLERSTTLKSAEYQLVGEGIGSPENSAGDGLVHGEGPIAIAALDGSTWYLFIDEFGLRRYVPFESTRIDTVEWTRSADYRLPAGASHGSILILNAEEWEAVGALSSGIANSGAQRD